ncbi:hypothetical protein WR25_19931 [Diploscapter pachys]|uniref:Uncharacterized protein n=1 Tax=Diploscapter pachys TaxID=2018661 RepID=A0A2A2K440_9BILA|nr:hypothetical protein WR25_19931 [Diploscapter pachys]
MSFSVHDPLSGLEYNGHDLNTLFAQRRNLLSPGFWGMLRDILRFNRQSLADLEQQRIEPTTTLGAYLDEGGYGQRFIEHYIVPMGSAIWSMSRADMLGFPLAFFVRFCRNHGLLSVNQRPQWRVVAGGSRSYVAPLCRPFAERIRLGCRVHRCWAPSAMPRTTWCCTPTAACCHAVATPGPAGITASAAPNRRQLR